jgi:hypothetical protein
MLIAVVIFVIGSAIQAGAVSVAMIFVGMLLKDCAALTPPANSEM